MATLDQDDLDAIAALLLAGVSVNQLQQAALEDLFTVDAGNAWQTAVDGSVVNELSFGAVAKRGFFGMAQATDLESFAFSGDLQGCSLSFRLYISDGSYTPLGTWDGATWTKDAGWVSELSGYLVSCVLENFTVPITGGTLRFSVPTAYAGTLGPFHFTIPSMTDTPEMFLLHDGKITTSLNAIPHTIHVPQDYPVAVTYRTTTPVGAIDTITWDSGAVWTYQYTGSQLAQVVRS